MLVYTKAPSLAYSRDKYDTANPCTKDCADRTPECHGTCTRYLAYRQDRDEKNQKKYSEKKRKNIQYAGIPIKKRPQY